MSIETKHKGHKIVFREESEEWFCEATGPKKELKAVKAAIDDLSRKERQINVKVLRVENENFYRDDKKIEEVTVTIICDPRREGEERKECWITIPRSKGTSQREKAYIHTLFPLDARRELEAWIELHKAFVEAREKSTKFIDEIVRHDADSLAAAAKEQAP